VANPYRVPSIESQAVGYAEHVIAKGARDWQEVQASLAEKPEFFEAFTDDVGTYQRIIRHAENRFKGRLPPTYID